MKLAYIIEVMYNSGGMERVLSVCANALCQDVEVSIITIYQMGRPCYFPIDDKISCYDLGLEKQEAAKETDGRFSDRSSF